VHISESLQLPETRSVPPFLGRKTGELELKLYDGFLCPVFPLKDSEKPFFESRTGTVCTLINRRCFFSNFSHAKPRMLLAPNSKKYLEEMAFPWTSLWLERDDRNVA